MMRRHVTIAVLAALLLPTLLAAGEKADATNGASEKWKKADKSAEAKLSDKEIVVRAGAFREVCGKLAGAARTSKQMAVVSSDRWLFLGNELRHVGVGEFWGDAAQKVSKASRPKFADPYAAIVHYQKEFDKQGIDLLVVPVPPKSVVYADKLPGKNTGPDGKTVRMDIYHQSFYSALRKAGVDVLDVTDELIALRTMKQDVRAKCLDTAAGQKDIRTYCRTDTHYSPAACEAIAKAIRRHVGKRDWYSDLPRPLKGKLATKVTTLEIRGDLLESGQKQTKVKLGPETLAVRYVGTKDGDNLVPVEPADDAPVLLLGDSHCLVFHFGGDMHAKGAGLADQLSYEFEGTKLDVIGVKGSGARPARISLYRKAKDDAYLKSKKLVIWCFAAREFTEAAGWGEIPLKR